MKYKREEPFRFTFSPPIKGTFLPLINTKPSQTSKKGLLYIEDISPSGLKVSSPLNLPTNEMNVQAVIQFQMNDKELEMVGTFVWKKEMASGYAYGVDCVKDPEQQKEIINEIKQYIQRTRSN
ncbi:PilZ domain-containing protein [Bacillus sp. CGMCC 1.16541]|uniref:PilZ domain-containing protein n=1 Tax=Bacillus sp. CGMCC 1.16541 TaxID=2185143 RepID=UPI0013A53565|nr:PilZ domain-containing protein [Bacillus sp. CGMCC 1.16541]